MADRSDGHPRVSRFVRFLLVGALNTLVGYSLFALLVLAGLESGYALLLATVAGVIFNFFTTGRIVFANRNNLLVLRFVAAYAASYGVNLALLTLLEREGFSSLVAQALCLPFIVLLSFSLLERFVFQDSALP